MVLATKTEPVGVVAEYITARQPAMPNGLAQLLAIAGVGKSE